MPRKSKRSQAQSLRWQRPNENPFATTTEGAECVGPESSEEVKMSAECKRVEQEGQPDASCAPPPSYADAVKRGQHSDDPCVAGPSNVHQVNQRCQPDASCIPRVSDTIKRGQASKEPCAAGPSNADRVDPGDQPSEQHVRASRSQASIRYGRSRNRQCTCNSLTFLAFLHENESITRADLDHVLDKGNTMYRETRKQVTNHIYLTTDELTDEVPARSATHHADMTQLSRYGTLGEPLPGAVDSFLDLESGLSCLLSDVKYALLLMRLLCIAVFRTKSGRYGFFDPHSRTARGLPLPAGSRTPGTAVMVTFSRLSDMIDRLKKSHRMMDTQSSCNYELKPVEFYNVNTVNLNGGLPNTDCRPTAVPVDESNSPIATDQTSSPETTPHTPAVNQPEVLITTSSHDAPHTESESTAQVINPVLSDPSDDILTAESSDIIFTSSVRQQEVINSNEPELSTKSTFLPSHDASLNEPSISSSVANTVASDLSDVLLQGISCKLTKCDKNKRRKMKRRLIISEKTQQRQESKKRKEREKYASNKAFKTEKKSHAKSKYQNNPEFRQKKINNTRDNVDFQQKRKEYISNRYRENADFRQKKKQIFVSRYRNNPDFREKKKQHFTNRYRDNAEFRKGKKLSFTAFYKNNIDFRQKKREKERSHIIQRYAHDQAFRLRHKQLMKQRMKDRYKNNPTYKSMRNMRCAMKIKRKYRQINKPIEESDNSLIKEAISVFRSQIKSGPTYVCTVCHKASFPNQVKPCKRLNYVRNPDVAAACLTGKYVHVCDDECRDEQQCNVPDERKEEWICHTCHNHLKDGVMPTLAVANNLELADIPPELCDLNILERHLIAKCIAFAKIIPLPKGRQRAIHGNVVCVPSEVQETVEALPRLRSESQVMRVKLKRRLCYRGHQLFQTVTWSKLVQALHILKRIHPQYQDIPIRDEAELCDPTLPDEDDDDDEDATMDDNDYDDADFKEIDMCDKSALCETETELDGEQDVDMLSCDGEQPEQQRDDEEQEGEMPNGGFALESCLQPCDVSEEILCFSEGIYSVAPAESNSPVGFFKTPKLEAMAFPVQFPTGQNTLDEGRRMKVTPSSYFKARLFCVDDRFARDTNYLFFAQFVTEIHLATSSMTIQLRKGKPMTRDGRKITSGMLQNKREVEKLVRNKDAVRFMQPLRGTPAYWEKTTRDLFAMIRQLGTPTFFCTFSAAEMRWPEVIEAIKRQQGEEVNFEGLDWSAKCDILRSNPVTTMRMFDKRVEALFRDVLLSPAQPLGKVVDYFYRVEFQHRGSPHIHCLIWVEGAPVFEEDDDKTVSDFVSKYITAQLPDQLTQPELYKKVTEVQIHSKKHSRTCFRSPSSGCRFGFPKPPSRKTMISRPGEGVAPLQLQIAKSKLQPLNLLLNEPETASLGLQQLLSKCNLTLQEYEGCLNIINKSSAVILKREPKDCWVNGYNAHLLEAWDANIDVSYILNAYSCIMYLTSYITKKESGLSEYLKTVIENSTKDHVNECDEMREIMQAYSKKREVSAQECVTRACGINMKKCSRGVIFVPTDDNALKMSRPMSYLENTTLESVNVWMTSLTDKYKSRPETPEFEQMCLADFAATCRIVYGQQKKGKDVLPLLNDMGFVQKRKNDKPAIIRFYRCSQEKYPEKFYGTLLKLYIPHRSDLELKRRHFPTYESFYKSGCVQLPGSDHPEYVRHIVKRNKDKYEKNSEDIENAVEEFEQNRGVIDEWCNLAPESEVEGWNVSKNWRQESQIMKMFKKMFQNTLIKLMLQQKPEPSESLRPLTPQCYGKCIRT
uniref:uncharacterized protein LOC120818062 isoform X1 n=1 Tax=Gasterosteus aculeatus aculeatus TaxID=481459 RepID=UPI001A992863|nr:uncharacterized protein LOC120818062 isoform X1 [Gasterosteus aculeatus aculeatus]